MAFGGPAEAARDLDAFDFWCAGADAIVPFREKDRGRVTEPPTGNVTFLFTDIQGSTSMWERDAEGMRFALARHDELLESAIETHGGFVFKTVGDAFCAAFSDVSDALEAALVAQRSLSTEGWDEGFAIRARMAIHSGMAEERGGDYFGPPVNRVTRLLSAGHGGQTLISSATRELVRDALPEGTELRDLGERRLKDLFRSERVFQLTGTDLPSSFPPLKTLDARLNNLPVQPTPLVGREKEISDVAGFLRRPEVRLLTLTGPGGIGKTRLGLQVAADLLDEYEGGVFFVALAPVSDPDLVVSTIAGPLGVAESGEQPLEERLKDHLRDKELLLVLDNFEQVLEASPLVGEIISVCPGVKVLATSRAALRVYGEQEYAVPPLALPDPRRLPTLEKLSQYEAVRLFIERARAVKAGFEVTNDNAPAVAEICVRLDGLPLAIELAAARTRALSPKAILSRLGSRLKLLRGGARDLPARQQTLRGAIEWSHGLLEEGERALFARLAVFVGGCGIEAIETICDAEGDLPVDALDGLESLVEKSLLRQESEGDPRFYMLETIREFALECLEESGEMEAIKREHAEYFLALAEEPGPRPKGPPPAGWLQRMEEEQDNFRAALRWALEENGDAELGLRLAGALSLDWMDRGHLGEVRGWLERGLAGASTAPAATRALALEGLGYVMITQHDRGRFESACEEALVLYRELEDKEGIAHSLDGLGWAAILRGDYERASVFLGDALVMAQESSDEPGIAMALNGLAVAEADQGNFDRAEALWEEALALNRRLGNLGQILLNLSHMAYTAAARGDLERAAALFEEDLTLARESKSELGRAWASTGLGLVAVLRGDHERAAVLLREGLRLHQGMETRSDLAECLEGLAEAARARGTSRRAAQLWGAADALREASGIPWMPREKAIHEPHLAAARSQLNDETWEKAFAEGRDMALQEAVAYALDGDRD